MRPRGGKKILNLPRGGKRLELAMPNGDWRPGRRLTCGVGITGAEMARRAVAVKTSASRRVRRQGESDALELFFSSVVGKKKGSCDSCFAVTIASRHARFYFVWERLRVTRATQQILPQAAERIFIAWSSLLVSGSNQDDQRSGN